MKLKKDEHYLPPMRKSLEWWRSLKILAQNVYTEYIDWDMRQPNIQLLDYYSPFVEYQYPPFNPISTEDRIHSLKTTAQTRSVVERLKTIDLTNTEVAPRIDGVLLLLAVCIDLKNQPISDISETHLDDILKQVDEIREYTNNDETIDKLATDLTTFLTEQRLIKAVRRELRNIVPSPESKSEDVITNRLEDAMVNSDTAKLGELYRAVVTCRWRQQDFEVFDPRSFEELIATLYRVEGYEVKIKSIGADGGVDVVARNDTITKAIQVKHESSRMSAPTLDQYVSLFEYYDTDEVIIVHKSSFTQPARERASKVSKPLTLINGQKLCGLLTDANISIPVL